MKPFAIVLVFLLLVGATVFYFGWIQIQIPPDGYGVIFTRTDGWEDETVRPGEFVWRWQRLIPTNLTLYVFEPGRHRTTVRLSGTLPSSEAIDKILEGTGRFDYELRLVVQSRIDAAQLPMLARDRGLRPDDLDAFYEETDARIAQVAIESLMALVESADERLSPGESFRLVSDTVASRIAGEIRYLDVEAVVPERIALPDLDLYREAKELAAGVIAARAASLREAASQLAWREAEEDRMFALLERYGAVLERFPVLLDYFRVGQEIQGDPLNLQSFVPASQ